MGTFTKTEVVDARQFTGGVKNSKELVAWITANGGHAAVQIQTVVNHDGTKVVTSTNETIELKEGIQGKTPSYPTMSSPGTWVILKQDGYFKTLQPAEFEAEYNQA